MENTPVLFDENNIPFADNPDARLPVTLVVDTSYSMNSENRIHKLNDGLEDFWDEVNDNVLTKRRAMINLIGCGGHGAYEIQPMATVQDIDQFLPNTLVASGGTPMDEALNLAMDKLDATKQTIKANDGTYYRPLMFVLSDGGFNLSEATRTRLHSQINENKFKVIPFGVGSSANVDSLSMTNPEGLAILLNDEHFSEFFEFLSSSVSTVSNSNAGEEVSAEPTSNMRISLT